jgi:hypothetical protein
VVCDTEFSGPETLDFFKSFWDDEHVPHAKLATLGLRIRHTDVRLETEQTEPLLLVVDTLAGLLHGAHLPTPGRIATPLTHPECLAILRPLQASGRLAVDAYDFETTYDEIFGPAMREARSRRDA